MFTNEWCGCGCGCGLIYMMSSGYPSEVGHVGDGAHRESPMDQSIVDEHVSHTKHRNSETLRKKN